MAIGEFPLKWLCCVEPRRLKREEFSAGVAGANGGGARGFPRGLTGGGRPLAPRGGRTALLRALFCPEPVDDDLVLSTIAVVFVCI